MAGMDAIKLNGLQTSFVNNNLAIRMFVLVVHVILFQHKTEWKNFCKFLYLTTDLSIPPLKAAEEIRCIFDDI